MDEIIKQRIRLKFCIANKIECTDSLKMLEEAYDKSTSFLNTGLRVVQSVDIGPRIVADIPCSVRPSNSSTDKNIEKMMDIVPKKPL